MMKRILKAGPNQMEILRRLRTEAAAIDKDVTVRSERIRQTRDFRIRFWFREKAMEQRFRSITLRRERRQNELSGTRQIILCYDGPIFYQPDLHCVTL